MSNEVKFIPDEPEIWTAIPDFEGYYEASTWGRIKGIERTVFKVGNSRGNPTLKEKILAPFKNDSGYLRVKLCRDNIAYTRRINRLIALAFIPNPLNLPEVNHLDGDKLNNRPSNLEWDTHKGNVQHAERTGLSSHPKNGDHIQSKRVSQYDLDGNFLRDWPNAHEAWRNGFCYSKISAVC